MLQLRKAVHIYRRTVIHMVLEKGVKMSDNKDKAGQAAGIGCMAIMAISGICSALLPVILVIMLIMRACR